MYKAKNLTSEYVLRHLPRRRPDSNKGDYGKLFLICGSASYRGCAALACEAALRTGVGLARLAAVEEVISAVAPRLPEMTYFPLDSQPGEWCASLLATQASAASACLCGCGLGATDDTFSIVKELISSSETQLVLDADALNVLDGHCELLADAKNPPILTPHLGEMSRISGLSITDIKRFPIETAAEFAVRYKCILVMKDSVTYIAAPDGRIYRHRGGNAGLARGGSGDLLAGIIASFAAQGMDPFISSLCGVQLLGAAADLCASEKSQYGMLPHDLFEPLCRIFQSAGK